jgi:isopenicillin N synthase-like dioxygenase
MSRAPSFFSSIPKINISDLMAKGAEACPGTVENLATAASEVGFFSIVGHGCPGLLGQRLIARATEFFAMPIAQKMQVYIGQSRNHRGYVPAGEEVFAGGTADKKEAFDLSLELAADDPVVIGRPLLGPNQWPSLPGFADDVMAYYHRVFSIGRRLMHGFALALGRPTNFFDQYLTHPPSQMRLIHYPYDLESIDSPGIGAHTDYECLTLLLATAPGLEVMNGKGEWIDAPPVAGGFMINIGDMLELLSDGRFVATSHRVRRVPEERYSFPLFFSLDYDTLVYPLNRPETSASIAMIAGEHIYAQTMQTFCYQKRLLEAGEISLPKGARALSSFGQEARQGSGR